MSNLKTGDAFNPQAIADISGGILTIAQTIDGFLRNLGDTIKETDDLIIKANETFAGATGFDKFAFVLDSLIKQIPLIGGLIELLEDLGVIEDRFVTTSEALAEINDELEDQNANLEQRIRRFERELEILRETGASLEQQAEFQKVLNVLQDDRIDAELRVLQVRSDILREQAKEENNLRKLAQANALERDLIKQKISNLGRGIEFDAERLRLQEDYNNLKKEQLQIENDILEAEKNRISLAQQGNDLVQSTSDKIVKTIKDGIIAQQLEQLKLITDQIDKEQEIAKAVKERADAEAKINSELNKRKLTTQQQDLIDSLTTQIQLGILSPERFRDVQRITGQFQDAGITGLTAFEQLGALGVSGQTVETIGRLNRIGQVTINNTNNQATLDVIDRSNANALLSAIRGI